MLKAELFYHPDVTYVSPCLPKSVSARSLPRDCRATPEELDAPGCSGDSGCVKASSLNPDSVYNQPKSTPHPTLVHKRLAG